MLEVTILKNTHSGRDEARKLLPYIKETHVYAYESALSIESEVIEEELEWEWIINKSNWSRSKFQEVFEKHLNSKNFSKKENEYFLTEKSYLFLNKVPIWSLERFSEEDIKLVNSLDYKINECRRNSIQSFYSGNINEYLDLLWKSLQLNKDLDDKRDQEIARNINRAEEILRVIYPLIADKEPLKCLVQVGALHTPEKYVNIPVIIKNIEKEPTDILQKLFYLSYKVSFDEAKTTMLAYGVEQLSAKIMIPSLSLKQIQEMNFDQLSAVVEKYCKK